ncbi:MAG: 50S ribosomal protein L6 [Acidobacteria bacterium]|nr:50S ribosomal protein L6 [Acidobacteriota bacterium]
MSRIGRLPISLPAGVTARLAADAVEVKGPKGSLRQLIPPGILFEEKGGQLCAQPVRPADRSASKFHGLARSLVANAVRGVSQGFTKELDIVGIGYRAEVSAAEVVFHLGYSHPVPFPIPDGIQIAVDKQNHITVAGIDRQRVGQVAADIRALRKPDPYKQKGIRYTGEVLKKKVGKTGA